MNIANIQQAIYEIRSIKVMFDFHLAALYEVETKVFNQAVKRNPESWGRSLILYFCILLLTRLC